MPMSCVRPGVAPSAVPGTPLLRPFSHVRYGALSYRLTSTRCRVLNLESLEIDRERVATDSDRLCIEVAYARSKLRDVESLAVVAEQQLEQLLALFSKPRRGRPPATQPPQPTVVVHKRLDWGAPDSDVFVQTTRNGAAKREEKRDVAQLPDVTELPVSTTSPFKRHIRADVLTADEEKELAVQIQRLMQIERFRREFCSVYNRQPTWDELSRVLETDHVQLEREHRLGQEAKQTMIERNMRLVISIANKLWTPGLRLSDLVVDGVFGLIRAVEKFDPERGYKFSTYAHWWIRQNINRAVSENSRVITYAPTA